MESLTGKTSEEVEIPKLAKNGRNWKIYCTKIIEATAMDITDPLGVLAGWQPDDGSYNWECLDAILKWTFYTSVPISILCPIRKLDTAHEIFKYLAKRFRNNEPIPRAKKSEPSTNKVDGAGTAAVAETPEKSPMSADAATEWHASAERNNEDLTTTKALTRGTEDIDDGNVGCIQDPRTSLVEASVQGTSAKCAKTTSVVLEGTPHETQDRLQNSLPLTPRPPIEGEPSGCKQEAADSVMTAGRTNGTVEMAKPNESDADVNGKATLGSEPTTVACGVDKGAETEHNELRLQETTNLLCEEIVQHNGNAENDIPSSHGLPLEGEWTVLYASSKLLTTTVEPYIKDSGTNAHVCLGATHWRAFDVERLGGRTDGSGCQTGVSSSQVDRSRGQTEAPIMSNRAETADIRHGDDLGTYLGVGHTKHGDEVTDGIGSHAHTLTGHGDTPSVEMDALTPADTLQIISIPRKKNKPPDLPVEATRGHPDESNGLRDHTDTSSTWMDAHTIRNETRTPANVRRNVRTRQTGKKMQYSPYTPENGMPKHTYRWKRVSASCTDVHVPLSVLIDPTSRNFVFGEVERGVEAIAPDVEGEMAKGAGDGNDGNDGGDGDVDGTTSGGSVDSMRVKAVLLAANSQYMHQNRRTRDQDLPVLSEPPIQHADRPYGHVRRRRRRGRIKFVPRNINRTETDGNAHLGRVNAIQLEWRPGEQIRRVSKPTFECRTPGEPWREDGRPEIEHIRINQAGEDEVTYHGRARLAQPPQTDSKRFHQVIGPSRRPDRIKIEPVKLRTECISDKTAEEDKTTHRICATIVQPPGNNSKRLRRVHRPRRRRG